MTAKNWNVAHIDGGTVEIEELYEEIRNGKKDFEDDGTPFDSFAVADRYVRLVERVPVMVELLRDAVAGFVPKAAPSWWYDVRALLKEVDGE